MNIIYPILSHKYIHIYAIPVYTYHLPIDPQIVSSDKIVVLTLRARRHPTLLCKGALYIRYCEKASHCSGQTTTVFFPLLST